MKRSADFKMVNALGDIPIRIHFRTDLHLMRKMFHAFMGLIIVLIYMSGISRGMGVLILGFFLGLDLFVEFTRLRNPVLNEKMVKIWGPFLRAHEMTQLSTIPHYIFAAMIAVGLFPKPIAVLSLLYLACGDPIASLAGILYGHHGPRFENGKTWIGTAAGVFVCVLVTFFYLKSLRMAESLILPLSLMGGLAGGMTELLPLDIDDNFTIPVISGFVLWFTFMMLGL